MTRTWSTLTLIALCAAVALGCEEEAEWAPADGRGGLITYLLATDETGAIATDFGVDHPLTVTMHLKPTEAVNAHHVVVGLVEKLPDGTPGRGHACTLGAFYAEYGMQLVDGRFEAAPTEFVRRFPMSPDCLPLATKKLDFNLWVALDPPESPADNDALYDGTNHVQFFNRHMVDTDRMGRNIHCVVDGAAPGCVQDIRLDVQGGADVVLEGFETNSSVGSIRTDCVVDFSEPMFAANGRLTLWGVANEPHEFGEEPPDGLDLAGANGNPVVIKYSICPADPDDLDKTGRHLRCAPDTTESPLAFAGEGAATTRLVEQAEIFSLPPAASHPFHHAFYAPPESEACERLTDQGDEDWANFGEFILRACLTPPFAEEGDQNNADINNCIGQRVRIIRRTPPPDYGRPPDGGDVADGAGGDGGDGDGEFGEDSGGLIEDIGRLVPDTGEIHFPENDMRMDYSFGEPSILAVDLGFQTANVFSSEGASIMAQAGMTASGSINNNLFDVHAELESKVQPLYGKADLGLLVMGDELWALERELPAVPGLDGNLTVGHTAVGTKEFAKAYCENQFYTFYVIVFRLTLCAAGAAGLDYAFSIGASQSDGTVPEEPFFQADAIGFVEGLARPYTSLMLNAEAAAGLVLVEAGVTGELTLLELGFPANGALRWGAIAAIPPKLKATVDATLNVDLLALKGRVSGWLKANLILVKFDVTQVFLDFAGFAFSFPIFEIEETLTLSAQ